MPNPELAQAKAASGTSASDLISTLRDKAPRAAMTLAAGQLAWPVVKAAHGKVRSWMTYTIKVPAEDDIYDDLHEWVLSLLGPRERRALVAWTSRSGMLMASDERPEPPSVRLRYDGGRAQSINVAGHKIEVVVADNGSQGDGEHSPRLAPIVFTASSAAGRDALLAEFGNVLRRCHEQKQKPAFRMLDRWGDWTRLDELPARDLDSVVLPAGQIERLVDDVARFLASEQDYVRRCIPWHRGHLYEGLPGTGKTSIARAIASHFGMDVWYLPLADVEKDGRLLNIVSRVGPRSMLLLEDVDVFHAATSRDDESSVTLSGLLNALDGIATPHGLLTVLTTNTPEVLDSALVRAGRVDLVEHFGNADGDQVARLLSRWYAQPISVPGDVPEVAPAQVVEVCKRHDDPADAVAALRGNLPTTAAA